MWLYFNKNGQLLEYASRGQQPSVGTNVFEIFAYFEGINDPVDENEEEVTLVDVVDNEQESDEDEEEQVEEEEEVDSSYGTGTIVFKRPDLQGSEYPMLFMVYTHKKYIKNEYDSDDSLFKEDGGPNHDGVYDGFLFDFSNFTATAFIEDGAAGYNVFLDTPGLWEATITLFSARRRNVTGIIKFPVLDSAASDSITEAADIMWNAIVGNLAQVLNSKQNVIDDHNMLSSDLVDDTDNLHRFATVGDLEQIVTNKNDIADRYTKAETNALLSEKQDNLVSGSNIKTINGQSIVGSGDITISEEGSISIDSELDGTSTNAIQNKVVYDNFVAMISQTTGYIHYDSALNTFLSTLYADTYGRYGTNHPFYVGTRSGYNDIIAFCWWNNNGELCFADLVDPNAKGRLYIASYDDNSSKTLSVVFKDKNIVGTNSGVDSTPTENSEHLVTSGGVYSAVTTATNDKVRYFTLPVGTETVTSLSETTGNLQTPFIINFVSGYNGLPSKYIAWFGAKPGFPDTGNYLYFKDLKSGKDTTYYIDADEYGDQYLDATFVSHTNTGNLGGQWCHKVIFVTGYGGAFVLSVNFQFVNGSSEKLLQTTMTRNLKYFKNSVCLIKTINGGSGQMENHIGIITDATNKSGSTNSTITYYDFTNYAEVTASFGGQTPPYELTDAVDEL